MKRFFTLLAALLLLSVAAFASAGGKVLGIVMPNATHGFLGESIKHARAAAEEYSKANGFSYKFLTSAEASEQNNQLDTLINEKVDCIVLWPHNGNELRSGAMKVMEAKIPLIIYDRLIDEFKPTAEVMGDNFTIGEETGRYLNKYFAEDLKKEKLISLSSKEITQQFLNNVQMDLQKLLIKISTFFNNSVLTGKEQKLKNKWKHFLTV